MTGVVESIQVGRPRWHGTPGSADPFDRPFATGFWKDPVAGPVAVRATQLDGDGQADLVNHGGPDKALLVYPSAHYRDWRGELALPELPHGAFGENLTVTGPTELEACIGDVWRVGTATFQVSQPRQPCWKLARRWRLKDLPARVVESGRCGWYLRVLSEGTIEAGQAVELVERPRPEWPVRQAHRVMYFHRTDPAANAELAAVPELSLSWREELLGRAG